MYAYGGLEIYVYLHIYTIFNHLCFQEIILYPPDFGHNLTFKKTLHLESVPPGYNRSNFFENLKLQQSRKFRRQQIIAAQADDSQSVFVREAFFLNKGTNWWESILIALKL